MEEKLITEILNCIMMEDVKEQSFKNIKFKLYMIAKNYDIKTKDTELIKYDSTQIPHEFKEYLATLKVSGLSNKTLQNYALELKLFWQWINTDIKSITSIMIKTYLYESQISKNLADVTVEHKRIVINCFYEWMVGEEYMDKNPCKKIKAIKQLKKKLEPLTNRELEEIRMACSDERERMLIEVLFSTGMRVSELVNVNISQIDFLRGTTTIIGKGNKERTIRFSEKSVLLIQEYLSKRTDKNDALIVTKKSPYKRITKAGIEYLIHEIQKKSGIIRFSITPHTFRRTHGAVMYARTGDIYKVSESLGHANISTTTQYVKLSEKEVQHTYDSVMN